MKILGIDPGTATIGWAVLNAENGSLSVDAYGSISTESNASMSNRLEEIADDIQEILYRYTPDDAAIEEIFFFKNQKTIISVSQARGVLLLTLSRAGLTIAEYTPLQVKQSITGYGRAEKKQVQEMVKSILKLKSIPKPDDAADAIAIAICHAQSKKSMSLLNI